MLPGPTQRGLGATGRKDQIQAVVIDSAFSVYRAIVRHHVMRNPLLTILAWWYPFGVSMGRDAIDFEGQIARVPVLFMHATGLNSDEVAVQSKGDCMRYTAPSRSRL